MGFARKRRLNPSYFAHRSKGGVLQIQYRSLDQLDEVIRRLERG
jgi:hypothetical protein